MSKVQKADRCAAKQPCGRPCARQTIPWLEMMYFMGKGEEWGRASVQSILLHQYFSRASGITKCITTHNVARLSKLCGSLILVTFGRLREELAKLSQRGVRIGSGEHAPTYRLRWGGVVAHSGNCLFEAVAGALRTGESASMVRIYASLST